MKTMVKIVKNPFVYKDNATLISVLITLLNFSSSQSTYVIRGM